MRRPRGGGTTDKNTSGGRRGCKNRRTTHEQRGSRTVCGTPKSVCGLPKFAQTLGVFAASPRGQKYLEKRTRIRPQTGQTWFLTWFLASERQTSERERVSERMSTENVQEAAAAAAEKMAEAEVAAADEASSPGGDAAEELLAAAGEGGEGDEWTFLMKAAVAVLVIIVCLVANKVREPRFAVVVVVMVSPSLPSGCGLRFRWSLFSIRQSLWCFSYAYTEPVIFSLLKNGRLLSRGMPGWMFGRLRSLVPAAVRGGGWRQAHQWLDRFHCDKQARQA